MQGTGRLFAAFAGISPVLPVQIFLRLAAKKAGRSGPVKRRESLAPCFYKIGMTKLLKRRGENDIVIREREKRAGI